MTEDLDRFVQRTTAEHPEFKEMLAAELDRLWTIAHAAREYAELPDTIALGPGSGRMRSELTIRKLAATKKLREAIAAYDAAAAKETRP